MTLLAEHAAEETMERELSLRLPRHMASSVRHQQYHDTDVLTVRVAVPGAAWGRLVRSRLLATV